MKTVSKRGRAVIIGAAGTLILAAGLIACSPQANTSEPAESSVEASMPVPAPEADEYGVVTADAWSDIYPDEYVTYKANEENSPDSGKHDYLELYPALNTMYKGYAFALGYDEASSHAYSLTSVKETPRTNEKDQSANCITCKTPQFTATVNTEGGDIYKQPFWDVVEQYTEPISCYNCHENDPESITVANKFFLTSIGAEDADDIPKESQACGQCHNEYFFEPETKEPNNAYRGTDQMTPDAILEYFNERDFSDWTHPDTGAGMIKVQHPEFETVYGGDSTYMAKHGMTCASCHMGNAVADDGSTYVSHTWKSPLENQELMDSTCNTSGCHAGDEGGIAGKVAAIQAEEEERVIAISEKIEDMINKIAEAREAGTLSDEELATLQDLHCTSQFYWDFVMVENSEGAHNPELTWETLDKAEAAADEALAMLS